MGCKNSAAEHSELFNGDVDLKRRLLTGFQVSKSVHGIEGNFQITFATTRKKKYERVEQTECGSQQSERST